MSKYTVFCVQKCVISLLCYGGMPLRTDAPVAGAMEAS
jgi:hypothetical protein